MGCKKLTYRRETPILKVAYRSAKTRANTCTGTYKYGFNGQEKVDEVSGSGNHLTAEFWEYDPRTGRRWNTDPITYPWQSTYAAFNNNPIFFKDPSGAQSHGPGDEKSQTPISDLPKNPETGMPTATLPIIEIGGVADKPGFFKRAATAIGGVFSSIGTSIANILRRGDEAVTSDAPYVIPGGLPQHSEFGQIIDIKSFSLNPKELGPSVNTDLLVAAKPGAGKFQFGQGPIAIAKGTSRGTGAVKETAALDNQNADEIKAQSESTARQAMNRRPTSDEYAKAGLIKSNKLDGNFHIHFIDSETGDSIYDYDVATRIVADRLGWNKPLKTK